MTDYKPIEENGRENVSQKVSVIVPVYKVEQYIHRCVDSILAQTYKNLEIILVNDGSPDQCGEIADLYSEKDERVVVIHKKNGGLSDARNAGMHSATGEYTLFVDSDDWLDGNMIQTLVNISLAHEADIVQSAFYYAYEDHLLYDNRYYSKNDSPTIISNQELMFELVKNEKIKNFAWGKLYKSSLIKDLPFKKGVLFEDVFWAHHVMKRVNTYVINHKPMCYYMQRNDSIVANYSYRNLDILKGLKERHMFIEKHYPKLVNESYKTMLKTLLIHYNLLLANRRKMEIEQHTKKIYTYIQENFAEYYHAAQDDKQLIHQLRLFMIHPYFNVTFLLSKKLLRKLRVLPQPVGLERVNL